MPLVVQLPPCGVPENVGKTFQVQVFVKNTETIATLTGVTVTVHSTSYAEPVAGVPPTPQPQASFGLGDLAPGQSRSCHVEMKALKKTPAPHPIPSPSGGTEFIPPVLVVDATGYSQPACLSGGAFEYISIS